MKDSCCGLSSCPLTTLEKFVPTHDNHPDDFVGGISLCRSTEIRPARSADEIAEAIHYLLAPQTLPEIPRGPGVQALLERVQRESRTFFGALAQVGGNLPTLLESSGAGSILKLPVEEDAVSWQETFDRSFCSLTSVDEWAEVLECEEGQGSTDTEVVAEKISELFTTLWRGLGNTVSPALEHTAVIYGKEPDRIYRDPRRPNAAGAKPDAGEPGIRIRGRSLIAHSTWIGICTGAVHFAANRRDLGERHAVWKPTSLAVRTTLSAISQIHAHPRRATAANPHPEPLAPFRMSAFLEGARTDSIRHTPESLDQWAEWTAYLGCGRRPMKGRKLAPFTCCGFGGVFLQSAIALTALRQSSQQVEGSDVETLKQRVIELYHRKKWAEDPLMGLNLEIALPKHLRAALEAHTTPPM